VRRILGAGRLDVACCDVIKVRALFVPAGIINQGGDGIRERYGGLDVRAAGASSPQISVVDPRRPLEFTADGDGQVKGSCGSITLFC